MGKWGCGCVVVLFVLVFFGAGIVDFLFRLAYGLFRIVFAGKILLLIIAVVVVTLFIRKIFK